MRSLAPCLAPCSRRRRARVSRLRFIARPVATWRPDTNAAVLLAQLGMTPKRWFSQTELKWFSEGGRDTVLIGATLLAGLLAGKRMPNPEFVPRNEAYKVVEAWLDKVKSEAAEHRTQRLALIEELKAETRADFAPAAERQGDRSHELRVPAVPGEEHGAGR